jgi:hypothetical protein
MRIILLILLVAPAFPVPTRHGVLPAVAAQMMPSGSWDTAGPVWLLPDWNLDIAALLQDCRDASMWFVLTTVSPTMRLLEYNSTSGNATVLVELPPPSHPSQIVIGPSMDQDLRTGLVYFNHVDDIYQVNRTRGGDGGPDAPVQLVIPGGVTYSLLHVLVVHESRLYFVASNSSIPSLHVFDTTMSAYLPVAPFGQFCDNPYFVSIEPTAGELLVVWSVRRAVGRCLPCRWRQLAIVSC